MHFVYIVRCADGTLYTGYARNPSAREKVHNAGRGARYTRGRRPVALVYLEAFDTRSGALKREHQLKRWSRARKAALAELTASAPARAVRRSVPRRRKVATASPRPT